MKRERLDFLVENALHTKRFALYVGRRCRSGTIRDVAAELRLDWQTATDNLRAQAVYDRVGATREQWVDYWLPVD